MKGDPDKVTSPESNVVEREMYIAARPETVFSFFVQM